jgi:hypothetical protein
MMMMKRKFKEMIDALFIIMLGMTRTRRRRGAWNGQH